MRRLRWDGWYPFAGLVVVLVIAAGFFAQQQVTARAFDRLEADQVAQDAQRLRIALDSEILVLSNYGSTNSIWDNSYREVAEADLESFAEDFPPDEIGELYGLDGVIGVGPDGSVRVGGLVGASGYTPLPADFARPDLLQRLFDPAAEAGAGRCGAVRSSQVPYLYCGFPAYPSDSGGTPSGGLIYLKALAPKSLATLGKQINMPVSLIERARPGATRERSLSSALGTVEVHTSTVDDDRIALDVSVPSTGGSPIVLESMRNRPIHNTAKATVLQMFLLMAGAGVILLVAVVLMVRQAVRRQMRRLRHRTEQVIASGDRSLRVGGDDSGEVGALGRAIDGMLDGLAARDVELQRVQEGRESQLKANYAQQRHAERQARQRAQAVVNDTAGLVMHQLNDVVTQVEAVRSSNGMIDGRVLAAADVTRNVVEQARQADRVIAALGGSLQQVTGITQMIASVAEQTNLLALNATIEAARAGEAGKGFGIVAKEVKELANTTTRQTEEITNTVESLEHDATDTSLAITRMAAGVHDIDQATAQVSEVARQQSAAVQRLDGCVTEAISRIRALTHLTEQMERRKAERIAASGTVHLRVHDRTYCADLQDLSDTGMRCSSDPRIGVQVGDIIDVELPLGDDTVRLDARLVRQGSGEAADEFGLEFVALSREAAALIHEYVATFLSMRG